MLSFLPTPIGNLEDISLRAIKRLQTAGVFFCEDTRVTKRLIYLLNQKLDLDIKTDKPFISLNSHSVKTKLETIEKDIFNSPCVYLSDAGMPCISDPGFELVQFCNENFIDYEFLPGANAALLGFCLSGFSSKEFVFFGFLQEKQAKRQEELNQILDSPYVHIIYESPKRIKKLLQEILSLAPTRQIFIAKELTKLHEKRFFGTADKLLKILEETNTNGEWVVAVDANEKQTQINDSLIQEILELKLSTKDKTRLLSRLTNRPAKHWYEIIVKKI